MKNPYRNKASNFMLRCVGSPKSLIWHSSSRILNWVILYLHYLLIPMFAHMEALFHYLHKPLLCKNVTLRIQCVINYFYGWIVRKLFRSKKVPNVYNIIMIMDGYNFEILTCKYYDSMNAFPRSKKQKPWRDIQQVSLSLSSKRSPQYSFCGPLLIRFRFFNS